MADAAFEWATARNLVRISPIHQEAEAKLVLGESFCVKDEHGTSTTENARMDLEESHLHAGHFFNTNAYSSPSCSVRIHACVRTPVARYSTIRVSMSTRAWTTS